MKAYKYFLSVFLFSFVIFGCTDESGKYKTNQASESESEVIQEVDTSDNTIMSNSDMDEREPTDDEIREFGQIISIEDSGYPMYVVTLDFPERQMKYSFNLNIEAISLSDETLHTLIDKYVTIYYLAELENILNDIQHKGKSLLGEYTPELDKDWYEITGELSGADEETPGDLPGLITVSNNAGESLTFNVFVTSEMVAVNGKTVTVFYSEKGVSNITYILPSEYN